MPEPQLLRPPYLQKGDRIGIVSPARKISFEEILPAVKIFQKWGLEVILGTHVFHSKDQFAGTDAQRLADLQQMLDDPSIKAIFCSRGGYGTIRIIDHLDFRSFLKNPKWITGYSDVTVLHSHLQQVVKAESLHATMPVNFPPDGSINISLESLHSALFGDLMVYHEAMSDLNRKGSCEGLLVGGNLSILYSLMASRSMVQTRGRILFLEDVDEYLYHIDRMMMNLKRAGLLNGLAGLMVGSMSRMNDNTVPYGKTANEIIAAATDEFDYPVCFDFPSGHEKINLALFLGRRAKLVVDHDVTLAFDT